MHLASLIVALGSLAWLVGLLAMRRWRLRPAVGLEDWSQGMRQIAADDPRAFCLELNERLGEQFAHGWGSYPAAANPLCWLVGRCLPHWGVIQVSDHLFRYSSQAVCSQMAQAMVDVATLHGVPARVVGLDGHVVAEARWDGAWHGFDPDYGVSFLVGDEIVSTAELTPEAAAVVYADHRLPCENNEVLAILARQRVTAVPAGGQPSPQLAAAQRFLHIANWALPLALFVVGGLAAIVSRW